MLSIKLCITQAQTETKIEYPTVGKKCPDIVLKNIKYFSKKKASLSEFSGKWLVLDFWNKHCAACVASFPRTNALQKQFAGKVQFMLVGIQDPEKQIEKKYELYRERENLEMPCSFDSVLARQWGIEAGPYIIVIDNHGVVQGITAGLYRDQIQTFLAGGKPDLAPVYSIDPNDTVDQRVSFDASQAFLINGNGGPDSSFLFRSILARFNFFKQQQFLPMSIGDSRHSSRFQVLGVPLYMLYNYAYFGVPFPGGTIGDSTRGRYQDFPILEIRDSSIFQSSTGDNKNLFSYSLILPPQDTTSESLQQAMQRDLQNYFGYEASVEIRKCDCWEIMTTNKAKEKLKSKGFGKELIQLTKYGYKARNYPFDDFLNNLCLKFQHEIIFDSSGIVGNIDFTLEDAKWINIEDARKSLASTGIELVHTKREMKVVVIRSVIKSSAEKKSDNISSTSN
jgi:thiol-disulfide isomerase/thioredoxin